MATTPIAPEAQRRRALLRATQRADTADDSEPLPALAAVPGLVGGAAAPRGAARATSQGGEAVASGGAAVAAAAAAAAASTGTGAPSRECADGVGYLFVCGIACDALRCILRRSAKPGPALTLFPHMLPTRQAGLMDSATPRCRSGCCRPIARVWGLACRSCARRTATANCPCECGWLVPLGSSTGRSERTEPWPKADITCRTCHLSSFFLNAVDVSRPAGTPAAAPTDPSRTASPAASSPPPMQ